MVSYGPGSQAPAEGEHPGPVGSYALFEALTMGESERTALPIRPPPEGHGESGLRGTSLGTNGPKPDPRPKDVFVGCINPFALTENLLGRKIDRKSVAATRIIQDTLQTDYEELFDMKHHSVLYAGLKLNKEMRMAEELVQREMTILKDRDLITPNVSNLEKLGDLEQIGLEGMGDIAIKRAGIQNNKLHLVLHADQIAKTVCNSAVTQVINDMCLPFGRENRRGDSFIPPNCSWRDVRQGLPMRGARRGILSGYEAFWGGPELQTMRKFDDPIQGATSNSWFIAALFSVYWTDPAIINRNARLYVQVQMPNDHYNNLFQRFSVRFFDKGGRNNNKTQDVEVDYRVPVNNSSEDLVYCRSSDGVALWPALYEKAFAKWMNMGKSDNANKSKGNATWAGSQQIDVTQMHSGDPVKAMAQINGRTPHYYFTNKHDALDLVGLVRVHCVNHRTICPMAAWTYASGGSAYRGCNLVSNHAYSVLGWFSGQDDKQYIIIRNPWGVTEPQGLTSYPGILTRVEPEHWCPASLLDGEGVMAVDAKAFKDYFACMGIAK